MWKCREKAEQFIRLKAASSCPGYSLIDDSKLYSVYVCVYVCVCVCVCVLCYLFPPVAWRSLVSVMTSLST